jgi:hypothetical protein
MSNDLDTCPVIKGVGQHAGKSYFLEEIVNGINEQLNAYEEKHYPSSQSRDILTAEVGRKYIKLVSNRHGRSVYCFIDLNGNIYKAASWKAPAKHIRGSVFEPNFSFGWALGQYGAAYLR